jgi:DNA-binding MarR family transcriptional regulator
MQQLCLTEFADKMSDIMPVIMKEFARRETNELCKGKITIPQFLILDFLHREGESTMTKLAHLMRVTTAAMTGIVDRLVRDRYVVRAFDPNDRRIIKVKLTTSGNTLVRNITEQKHKMIIRIFGKISMQDRQEYLRILMQIKDILTEENSHTE